jgi:HSP20 family protein
MRTLARWEPIRNFTHLHEQINRLLTDPFPTPGGDESSLATWSPAVDIYEEGDNLVLKADLPDVQEKELDIRVESNTLTISGERKFEKKVAQENYLRIERSYGSFSRSFSLPNTVNADAIKADYKNGTLTVTLPKREESKPKQIKVSLSNN